MYKEDICICSEWSHYINDPTWTRLDNRNTIAEHLFVINICIVKYVGTYNRFLPDSVLKRKAVYCNNREVVTDTREVVEP